MNTLSKFKQRMTRWMPRDLIQQIEDKIKKLELLSQKEQPIETTFENEYFMNTARCTLDGYIYDSFEFSALTMSELLSKRDYLICPECKGRAFFRHKSYNGRTACFGARPHQNGCSLTAYDSVQNDCTREDGQAIFVNPQTHLVIDLGCGRYPSINHNTQGNPDNRNNHDAALHSINLIRQNSNIHRKLNSLLRTLTTTGNIPLTVQQITIDGLGVFNAADFFVNFNATRTMQEWNLQGFWGKINNANFDPLTGTLWMNTRGWPDPSICISYEFVGDLFQRFGIEDANDLTGANVLIIGMLKTATNSKKCIKLANFNIITIALV